MPNKSYKIPVNTPKTVCEPVSAYQCRPATVEFASSDAWNPQVVTFEIPKEKQKLKSQVYHDLNSAFADVRLMMDGKKRKKSLDELINELRNNID